MTLPILGISKRIFLADKRMIWPFTETIKDGIGIKKVDKITISKKNIERKINGVKHL